MGQVYVTALEAQVKALRDHDADLGKIFDQYEETVKALRGKLERLSAPVSDEEFIKHCSLIWIQDEDTQGFLFERDDVDALLAARAAEPPADKATE